MRNRSVFSSLMKRSRELYSMESAGMGCLSVFMMQDPSFLSHQKRLEKRTNSSNFETLFGVSKVPCPNQIRNMLDNVSPKELHGLYDEGLKMLIDEDLLKKFEFMNHTLIALDGVEYHSSRKIFCSNCNSKNSKGITTYSHIMLASSIVSPNIKEALALRPEFITPQDGHKKQDCENAAMKRWLKSNAKYYSKLNPIYLGDDLYSKEPICKGFVRKGVYKSRKEELNIV